MEINNPALYYYHHQTNANNNMSEGNSPTRVDSYEASQNAQISHNLISSLSSYNDHAFINNTVLQQHKSEPILSPSPVPMMETTSHFPTNNNKNDASDEILAIQALGQLKNSTTPPPPPSGVGATGSSSVDIGEHELLDDEEDDEFYDTSNDIDALSGMPSIPTNASTTANQLLSSNPAATGFFMRNIKSHPLYNSALRAYRINKPTIKYGVEMVERAAIPMVNIVEQTRLEWKRKKRLRRANAMFPDEAKFLPHRRSSLLSSNALRTSSSSSSLLCSSSLSSTNLPSIAEALALGNKNLNEFGLNLSIESKKRIATCLQLLMLANKQIASKIQHLQNLIAKEQELMQKSKESPKEDDKICESREPNEETDANTTVQIKQEIVSTVKKVVSLISKYAGNSLPEPARSNVRETLLRLPTKWATNTTTTTTPTTTASTSSTSSSSSSIFNTNGKVLILANESLEMVSSVMSVFDETLTKAELWVKQKQEKQLAKAAILNNLHQQSNNSSLSLSTSMKPDMNDVGIHNGKGKEDDVEEEVNANDS